MSKIVTGVLSFLLGMFLLYQSKIVCVFTEDGYVGIAVAIMMIAAGAVLIVSKESKIGKAIPMILYIISFWLCYFKGSYAGLDTWFYINIVFSLMVGIPIMKERKEIEKQKALESDNIDYEE